MLARGLVQRERARRAEEARRRREEEAALRRRIAEEEVRLREEARLRKAAEAAAAEAKVTARLEEEEALAARVRAAEARLRGEEERRKSGRDEAEARLRAEEEQESVRSAREAELRQRLAAVEEAERQLQQEDERQRRALDARSAAEQRDLRTLWQGGPTGASLASPGGSKRSGSTGSGTWSSPSGPARLEDVLAAAAERQARPKRRSSSPSLTLNLGGSGRVIPRQTPPASPTAAELEAQAQRDFPETAASLAGRYSPHPALALGRTPSGGVSDLNELLTLPDAPATTSGWVSPSTAAAEAAAAAEAEAEAEAAQGNDGERRMSKGALEVLGAVSHEEYHGIVEYAAYLGMHPVTDVHLLWVARDALHASVPAPWVEGLDMRERLYYYNTVTEETLREHPLDEYYRQLYLHHAGRESLLDDAGTLAEGSTIAWP